MCVAGGAERDQDKEMTSGSEHVRSQVTMTRAVSGSSGSRSPCGVDRGRYKAQKWMQ